MQCSALQFRAVHHRWCSAGHGRALRCSAVRYPLVRLVPCRAVQCAAVNCTALCRSALHCTKVHCIALSCNALWCTVLHPLYQSVMHCSNLQCTPPPCTALYLEMGCGPQEVWLARNCLGLDSCPPTKQKLVRWCPACPVPGNRGTLREKGRCSCSVTGTPLGPSLPHPPRLQSG